MDAWGVDDGYWDVHGTWHDTPPEVRLSLRVAMGARPEGDDPPPPRRPVWIVRQGTGPALERPALLVIEDGTELQAGAALPSDLPLGYHDLHPSDGGITTRLIVTPDRTARPPDRTAALAVQLYAARSKASWGIGDLADLAAIARWADSAGLGALLCSPLHAPQPATGPSPYYPSSRCWRSPLHLRVEDVIGYDPADPTFAELAERGRALNDDRRIDRAVVWALKRAALERAWAHARRGTDAFVSWRAAEGEALEQYATFCALADHHGGRWGSWPGEYRRPEHPAVAHFAAEHPDDVAFHAWLQWEADRQHAAVTAGTSVGLVHDLAVGGAPDGADAWLWQDLLAPGIRVGAPPDEFNAAGQDWGLPPFVPWRLRAAGYEPLARLLRASFRHAAGLRVDHVMGLFRLWWVPAGCGPAVGGYVRYPAHEMLDVLALESVRAGAFVVGEDLGTVEAEVRTALGDRGVLSYRVAWFEDDPPAAWPRQALAAMSTHDLPTVAGVWSGEDDPGRAMGPRLAALLGHPPAATAAEAVIRAHRRLASAPSQLVSATLEDALVLPERPNVPGTTTGHPNWSVALPVPIDDLPRHSTAAAVLQAITASECPEWDSNPH